MLRELFCIVGDNLLMNPQLLWCTLDARAASGEQELLEQLQAYAAIKSFGEMAHQPFGIVLEVSRAFAAIAVSVPSALSGGCLALGCSAERE